MRKKKTKVLNPRVPRTRANETKTEAEFIRYLKCFLRKQSLMWKPYSQMRTRNSLKNERMPSEKKGKNELAVICAGCNCKIARSDAYVDHKEPVVPAGYTFKPTFMADYDETKHVGIDFIVGRMFVEEDGLHLLCKSCHKSKGCLSYDDWLKTKVKLEL